MKASLDVIYGHCDEVGACMIWRRATNNSGQPQMRLEPEAGGRGKLVNVRRVAYQLLHPDKPLGARMFVRAECGNSRCISKACLKLATKSDYMKAALALNGQSPTQRQKITERVRQRTGRTMEDARAIRERVAEAKSLTEGYAQQARIYGVHIDTIRNIVNHKTWRDTRFAPNATVFAMRA